MIEFKYTDRIGQSAIIYPVHINPALVCAVTGFGNKTSIWLAFNPKEFIVDGEVAEVMARLEKEWGGL